MMSQLIKPVIYFLGLFLIGLPLWTQKYFGDATVDQLLFTIHEGFNGALTADHIFIERFINWCIKWPAIITTLLLLAEYVAFHLRGKKTKRCYHFIVLSIGALCTIYQFNVLKFAAKELFRTQTDYYASHYIDPKNINFTANNPKSLVLIYVESLENTYSDKNLFGRDILHKLSELKKTGLSFTHYKKIPGTEWTIAGIVSTQCGVPLKTVTIFGNNRQGEQLKQFIPNAKCLSDILAEHGYKNVFMNGPSLDFAGVGRFLRDHHYTELYGRKEWLLKGVKRENMNEWGLYDDDLFAQARIKLTELIQQKTLFNLTILTIDTHGANGYLSKTCKQQGYDDFEGIVECTANQVSDFINFIKKNDWLDQLNIVIVGDHLAMKNPVYEKLTSHRKRSIFNLIITNQSMHKNTDEIVPFDMLPTILDVTGIKYQGGRVALGYSGFSFMNSTQSSAQRIAELKDQIENHSEIYNQLWQ